MALASAELSRMGPPEPHAADDVLEDEIGRPSGREALADALPGLLGADELRDENDILFIANAALMAGQRDPAQLIAWLGRQEMLAKMSKMWVEDNKYQRAPARVSQIAKYLRYAQAQNERFGR